MERKTALSYNINQYSSLGKIRHKNVIRRHDETRRQNYLGNWLYVKVSRKSFYVAMFSRRCDNVVYIEMSSQRFYDVRDVKRRPENFHIQPNIHVLWTSGFDGRRLAEWGSLRIWTHITYAGKWRRFLANAYVNVINGCVRIGFVASPPLRAYVHYGLLRLFYGLPDGSQRAIMFLPFPSVRSSMEVNFCCLKTRFMGFWEGLGGVLTFLILSVGACVRYALCTKFSGLNLS